MRIGYTMKILFVVFLLLPLSLCYCEPASPNTTLTFYITDDNLNTSHRGIDIIQPAGLVDFTINGISIPGPSSMTETGVNTGTFQIQLTLPSAINGPPLKNGDVVVVAYHQKADYSGNPQTITQSRVLTVEPSNLASSVQRIRIGQDFTLRLYAPNFNLDSYHPDDIPLGLVEFRMGGIKTTLADSVFHVNTFALRETGPDTGMFEATFKIPQEVDGFPVEIGSTLEFRFIDTSEPSASSSSVVVKVGSYGTPTRNSIGGITPPNITFYTDSLGLHVNYLNSSMAQNLISPICYPSPNSFFTVGKTMVTCSGKDQQGNSLIKAFTVTVVKEPSLVPHWIKKLTSYWCSGEITDNDMDQAIKYLASSKKVTLSYEGQSGALLDKTSLCLWSDSKISDSNVTRLLAHLVR